MKPILAPILALLFTTASLAQTAEPLCVIDPAGMPDSWRPAADIAEDLDPAPWSLPETADVLASIEGGVDEMIVHFDRHPGAVADIWEDAVGAVIEVSYSSANSLALDSKIRDAARDNLAVLIEPYLDEDPAAADCSEVAEVMPLALYASKFYPPVDGRIGHMVATTNAAIADCGSLDRVLEHPFPAILADPAMSDEIAFDLVIWNLLFIEGELVPGLDMPQEMRGFSATLWTFLETYPLPHATSFEDGAYDDVYIDLAYLATHIAYIPTGNHRFPIYIEDSPALYGFLRENFYPVLAMGELDLVAEFVDSLRQYGCTPENDIQVRDGTRYLLEIWHEGGESWMAYREPGKTDADVDDYDLVHKAWTAVLGVRPRLIESAAPGT